MLIFFLTFILLIILCVYKSDFFWNISKSLPLHTNSGRCIQISDKICLSEDAGLRQNYYEASSLCSKKGMSLPTAQDYWEIWTASENCQRAFSSNEDVPKNKEPFVEKNLNEVVYVPANSVKRYCKEPPIIKFPVASQYKGGMFWLKDSAGDEKHYIINFNNAKFSASDSYLRAYGVRCVKSLSAK